MKKFNIFIIIILAVCSCDLKTKNKSEGLNTTINNVDETTNEISSIEQNGKSFYNWYFKNKFPNCNIIENVNGKCLVDTISYFKELRKLNTISEKFINLERKRLQGCAEFLSTVDFTEYDNADAYDFDEYCPDIYYMYWIKSQEAPQSFLSKNSRQINKNEASLDIYVNYGGENSALSTVFLEKEQNVWKITEIKFINQQKEETSNQTIYGNWQSGIVVLHVSKSGLAFQYHGQCMYFYPIKIINKNEFEMIWAKDMDCSFDNGTSETFGLKNVPEIGKPFVKYTLKNKILYAEYYYKEWVEKYSNQTEGVFAEYAKEIFVDKYFIKSEND